MIKVFGSTDKVFTSNGDVVVKPIRAKVKKEDNEDYYLELETDISYSDYFVNGNIIVANTPQGDQAFRISNPTKTGNKITVKAWHVYYDSENYLIADSNVVNKNCNNALNHLNSATEPLSEFTVSSDVTAIKSYRCVRESLYTAIEKVRELWGGHLVRDNFDIKILEEIGQDNGVTVQYKKNLKELTCEENWDDVVTKLLPVGKDGILLNALNPSASIYIVSDLQYSIPYTKTVSFSQENDKKDYPTETAYKQALINDLRSQAEEYIEKNCVPLVNYTLKANLEKITEVGDIIEVNDERLGVNLLTNVISFDYDCILGQYTQVEFGNFKPTLSGLMTNITTSVDNTVNNTVNEQISANFQAITNSEIDDIVSS